MNFVPSEHPLYAFHSPDYNKKEENVQDPLNNPHFILHIALLRATNRRFFFTNRNALLRKFPFFSAVFPKNQGDGTLPCENGQAGKIRSPRLPCPPPVRRPAAAPVTPAFSGRQFRAVRPVRSLRFRRTVPDIRPFGGLPRIPCLPAEARSGRGARAIE